MLDHQNPKEYARKILYLRNPSTIRARVLEEYGRAPSIDWIEKLLDERKRAPIEYGEPSDHDGVDFQVRSYVKRRPARNDDVEIKPVLAVTPDEIISELAKTFNMTYRDIVGKGKSGIVCRARFIIAGLLIERGNTTAKVAAWLGGRDRSTIVNAYKQFKKLLKTDAQARRICDKYMAGWDLTYSFSIDAEPLPLHAAE